MARACGRLLYVLCVCILISWDGPNIARADADDLECLQQSGSCQPDKGNPQSRSIVYLYGVVYTVDGPNWHTKPQQAIVIEGGKIAYVGSNEEAIKKYIHPGRSEVYDLKKRVVFPGLHDIHMHPLEAKSPVGGICKLRRGVWPNSTDITEELSVCPEDRVGTEWVVGFGYSIEPMLEYIHEGNSPKELLDQFIYDRPAAMLEETSHSIWVNSKALEWANISKSTVESIGGVIMREPNSNEPNGILFENWAMVINELAMDPVENSDMYYLNYIGLLDALYELSANGITSMCDARVFWKVEHDLAWQDACDSNNLTVHAILGLWAYPLEDDDTQIAQLKSLYSNGTNNCSLRISQIKVYMDGIVQSTTAAMLDQYHVNLSLPLISEKNIGINYFTRTRLERYLRELQDLGNGDGFDFHIHAIGDRGIREALDAIENTKNSSSLIPPRHRLTHLEIVNETDILRFKTIGVIADVQVSGDFTLPAEHGPLAEFVGKEKADFSIPVKSLVDSGAKTTFSSDWDVSELNPFVGIQHATQRGAQSVSVKTAIEMYTINPAYAMRQEDTVGKLVAGMDADLIVVDSDILRIPNSKISSTKVLETVFLGKSIYRRPDYIPEDISDQYVSTGTCCGYRPAYYIGLFIYLNILFLH